MRTRIFAIFTTWVFVSSLAVLLINDHVLKQEYPGANAGMFGDGELRKAEKLRAEIKQKRGLRFSGLESVEPLRFP